jgi:hypothetical protein
MKKLLFILILHFPVLSLASDVFVINVDCGLYNQSEIPISVGGVKASKCPALIYTDKAPVTIKAFKELPDGRHLIGEHVIALRPSNSTVMEVRLNITLYETLDYKLDNLKSLSQYSSLYAEYQDEVSRHQIYSKYEKSIHAKKTNMHFYVNQINKQSESENLKYLNPALMSLYYSIIDIVEFMQFDLQHSGQGQSKSIEQLLTTMNAEKTYLYTVDSNKQDDLILLLNALMPLNGVDIKIELSGS